MRTSCIRLRAKSRIAILFEDFLEILGGNMLAAMLLAILVYWTDVKIGKKDSNLWIWKSHADFQEYLMFDKEGMKPPHRTTIKSALDLLVEKKFVYRRKNSKMPLDQTKQYLVDQTAVQAAIDALPPIVVLPTLESRNSDIALSNKQQSLSENRQCNAEKPTSNTNDYSTEITESVITEERESVVASAPTAPAFPEPEYHFYGTEQQHLLWNCQNWCNVNHGTCADYVTAIEAGLHESPTEKMPAVPLNVTPVSHSQSSIPDGYMQGEVSDGHLSQPADLDVGSARSERAVGGTEQAPLDGQVAPIEQASDGVASTAPPRSGSRASEVDKPQKGKRNGKARAEPVLKCDPSEVQQRLNERRGYALEERVAIIRENVAIKAWCALHTLDEFEQVMTRLQERDYTGFDVYKGNGPEERAYYAAIGASLPDSYFDQ